MKKLYILLTLLMGQPLLLTAQFSLNVSGGYAVPFSEFHTLYHESVTGEVALKYNLNPQYTLQLAASFQNYDSDHGIQFRFFPVTMNLIRYFMLPHRENEKMSAFFVSGGFGVYFEHAEYKEKFPKTATGKIAGLRLGCGIEIFKLMKEISLSIHPDFHFLLDENNTSFIMTSVSLDFPVGKPD